MGHKKKGGGGARRWIMGFQRLRSRGAGERSRARRRTDWVVLCDVEGTGLEGTGSE